MKKIILLRHGEVDIENDKNISANEFGQWIIEYNNSNIKPELSSKNEINNLLNKTDILICELKEKSGV
jgi:exosome complex RNA-binding protein Csl4